MVVVLNLPFVVVLLLEVPIRIVLLLVVVAADDDDDDGDVVVLPHQHFPQQYQSCCHVSYVSP